MGDFDAMEEMYLLEDTNGVTATTTSYVDMGAASKAITAPVRVRALSDMDMDMDLSAALCIYGKFEHWILSSISCHLCCLTWCKSKSIQTNMPFTQMVCPFKM